MFFLYGIRKIASKANCANKHNKYFEFDISLLLFGICWCYGLSCLAEDLLSFGNQRGRWHPMAAEVNILPLVKKNSAHRLQRSVLLAKDGSTIWSQGLLITFLIVIIAWLLVWKGFYFSLISTASIGLGDPLWNVLILWPVVVPYWGPAEFWKSAGTLTSQLCTSPA